MDYNYTCKSVADDHSLIMLNNHEFWSRLISGKNKLPCLDHRLLCMVWLSKSVGPSNAHLAGGCCAILYPPRLTFRGFLGTHSDHRLKTSKSSSVRTHQDVETKNDRNLIGLIEPSSLQYPTQSKLHHYTAWVILITLPIGTSNSWTW